MPPLEEYRLELKRCKWSWNATKRIKRAARLAVVKDLQVAGQKRPFESKRYRPHTAVKKRDALKAYVTASVNREPESWTRAWHIVSRLASAAGEALGPRAERAFILVKGGAVMRYHFESVRARTSPERFAALEEGNLAVRLAMEPSDVDVELCLAQGTRAEKKAIVCAVSEALTAAVRDLKDCRFMWRYLNLQSETGHALAVFRLLAHVDGATAEVLDFAIPSSTDPRALRALKMKSAGRLIEFRS